MRAQSHWMLYALNALDAVAPVAMQRAYACRIAGAMIAFPIYRTYGISTTIACHAESLAAYLKVICCASARGSAVDMPSEALARPALEQDLVGLEYYVTPDGDVLEGGDAPEVQIDTIQHAAAAFLGHAALDGLP